MTAKPLIQYLRQLQSQGQTHVGIDDEARKILREFYQRIRGGSAVKQASSQTQAHAVAQPTENPPQPIPVRAEIKEVLATGNTAAEKIDSLKRQAVNWDPIKVLTGLRKTMVFSGGNPDADVMLVGEAPGYDEERLGEPFVGKAGQKLDGILKAMGLERRSVYISNIVKYRPSMPNQTTNNRKPTREEIDAFLPFICEEVKVVAPKVIIALGGTAAQALLGAEKPVAGMRGQFYEFAGTPLRVTYHPSYILHNEATSEKRKLWEDMLAVMEYLKMPVSEKQRSYFL